MPIQGQKTSYIDLFTTQYIPYLLGDVSRDLCSHVEYWDSLSTSSQKMFWTSFYSQGYMAFSDLLIPIGSMVKSANWENTHTEKWLEELFYSGFDMFRYHMGFYKADPANVTHEPITGLGSSEDYMGALNESSRWLNTSLLDGSFSGISNYLDDLVRVPFGVIKWNPDEYYADVSTLGLRLEEVILMKTDMNTVSTYFDKPINVFTYHGLELPTPEGPLAYYRDLDISSCNGYFSKDVWDKWMMDTSGQTIKSETQGGSGGSLSSLAFRLWLINYLFNNKVIGTEHAPEFGSGWLGTLPMIDGLIGTTGAVWDAAYLCETTQGGNAALAPSTIVEDGLADRYAYWPADFKQYAYDRLSNGMLLGPGNLSYTRFTPQKMAFNLNAVMGDSLEGPGETFHYSYVDHHFDWFEPYNSAQGASLADSVPGFDLPYYNISSVYSYYLPLWENAIIVLNNKWEEHKYGTGLNTDVPFELFLPNFHITLEETQSPIGSLAGAKKIPEWVHSTLGQRLKEENGNAILRYEVNSDGTENYVANNEYFFDWQKVFLAQASEIFDDGDFLYAVKKNANIILSPEVLRNRVDIDEHKHAFPFYVEFELKGPPNHLLGNILAETGIMPFFLMDACATLNQTGPPNNKILFEHAAAYAESAVPNNYSIFAKHVALPFSKYQGGAVRYQENDDFWTEIYNVDYFIATIVGDNPVLTSSGYMSGIRNDHYNNYFYITSGEEDYDEDSTDLLASTVFSLDQITNLQNMLNGLSLEKLRPYVHMCSGIPAYSEVVFFEVKKYKVRPNGTRNLIQTFVLPNVSNPDDGEQGSQAGNVLKFVDSQVLPGVDYDYEIDAFNYVLGSTYSYSLKGSRAKRHGSNEGIFEDAPPFTSESFSAPAPVHGSPSKASEDKPGNHQVPPKMMASMMLDDEGEIESESDITFFTPDDTTVTNPDGSHPPGITTAQINLHIKTVPSHKLMKIPFGKTTAPVRIIDSPPITPQVNIVPYRARGNKLYIALNTGADDIYDYPQGITREEQNVIYADAQYSHDVDMNAYTVALLADTFGSAFGADTDIDQLYPFGPGKVRFKSDGDVYAFEAYRISEEDMPHGPRNIFDFGSPVAQKTTLIRECRTTFIDTVKPNVNYYYIFRALDKERAGIENRGWSNPTDIYRVKLIKSRDNVYLDMETQPREYFKAQTRIKDHIPTKPFKKYLMIRPTLEQSVLNTDPENGGVDYWDENIYMSYKDFFLGNKQEAENMEYPGIDIAKPLGMSKVSIWGTIPPGASPTTQNGGKFRVRIKSKHTGKKVDIILGINQPKIIDNTGMTEESCKAAAVETTPTLLNLPPAPKKQM